MWVEYLKIENIRCFPSLEIKLDRRGEAHRWITLLGENGVGKSTILQALGLLLAGPEGVQQLLPRPVGWLRHESKAGKISVKIHQGEHDPGQFGKDKVTRTFGYSFHVTGSQEVKIRNKTYTEPTIVPSGEQRLTWLRQNALMSRGKGWFAAGYGAFRRLTRSSQIIIPSLGPQARFTNFLTQFDEDEPLSTFERWMVYLDYRIAKGADQEARRQKELGVAAIDRLLPEGVSLAQVTAEGRILLDIQGEKIPTIALSDGYRSLLALAGDLIWRLILSFPQSEDPTREEGVVLIDELDIHLHPIWQRNLPGLLRSQFPNLQFFVATHSPLIAAGADEDALTLRFRVTEDRLVQVEKIDNVAAMNVDRILQSIAFGLISPYSPQTQKKIQRHDDLLGKRRTAEEEQEFGQLSLFVQEARPFGGPPAEGSLDAKMDKYLEEHLP